MVYNIKSKKIIELGSYLFKENIDNQNLRNSRNDQEKVICVSTILPLITLNYSTLHHKGPENIV
jgi:hypothetical protein